MAPFRLMTWNVENLLRVGDQGGPTTQAELDAKLHSLAKVIDTQQPDMHALQEIGHPDMLAALQHQLTHKLPHHQLSTHPTSAASVSPAQPPPAQRPRPGPSAGQRTGTGAAQRPTR